MAVLPAFNEASCIGALLTSFCEAIEEEGKPCRIVVVDDGSTDGTGRAAALPRKAFNEYKDVFISEPGFSCMVDILPKLRKYEPIVAEVPIIPRCAQKKSVSKMKVGRTVGQTLRLPVRRRLFGAWGP